MNIKETLQYCRQQAKKNGQTFHVHKRGTIGDDPVYYYTGRKTGNAVVSNMTLSSAFEYACQNCDLIVL